MTLPGGFRPLCECVGAPVDWPPATTGLAYVSACHRKVGMVFSSRPRSLLPLVLNSETISPVSDTVSKPIELCD